MKGCNDRIRPACRHHLPKEIAVATYPASHAARIDDDLDGRPLVLVVHRSPSVRHALFVTLDLDGFDVLVAADGAEATALVTELRPLAVVTDLSATDQHMDDFLRRLHDDAATARLPIVDFELNPRPSSSVPTTRGVVSAGSLTTLLDLLRRLAAAA
jgi:hypothetical protein